MLFILVVIGLLSSAQPLRAKNSVSTIVITKIAASPQAEEEWIEIYNRGGSEIDLADWRFVEGVTQSNPDGVRHKLEVVQGDLLLAPYESAVIAESAEHFLRANPNFQGTLADSSWSSLKEEGEFVALVDQNGVIIESFVYKETHEGILTRVDPNLPGDDPENWKEMMGQVTTGHDSDQTSLEENAVSRSDSFDELITPDVFSPHDMTVAVGEEIIFEGPSFTNQADQETAYRWDFDDGEKAEGAVVGHVFEKEGDYRVRVYIKSKGALNDKDIRVRVIENESVAETPTTARGIHENNGASHEVKDEPAREEQFIPQRADEIFEENISASRVAPTQSQKKSSKKNSASKSNGKVSAKRAREEEVRNLLEEIEFTEVGDTENVPPPHDIKGTVYKYLIATATALGLALVGLKIKEWRGEKG